MVFIRHPSKPKFRATNILFAFNVKLQNAWLSLLLLLIRVNVLLDELHYDFVFGFYDGHFRNQQATVVNPIANPRKFRYHQ